MSIRSLPLIVFLVFQFGFASAQIQWLYHILGINPPVEAIETIPGSRSVNSGQGNVQIAEIQAVDDGIYDRHRFYLAGDTLDNPKFRIIDRNILFLDSVVTTATDGDSLLVHLRVDDYGRYSRRAQTTYWTLVVSISPTLGD